MKRELRVERGGREIVETSAKAFEKLKSATRGDFLRKAPAKRGSLGRGKNKREAREREKETRRAFLAREATCDADDALSFVEKRKELAVFHHYGNPISLSIGQI